MCGFVGVSAPGRMEAVRDAVASINHRGPDAHGVWSGEGASGVTLGSVRLRIIDLSPEADQPMANPDGTVHVSFNGELYNIPELRRELEGRGYVFRTDTDTEILVHGLHAYANDIPAFLRKLRGMFAFASYDSRTERLTLARDRLGIKPLYVCELPDGGIAFGSEIRAVVRAAGVQPTPDVDAVRGYLLRGVVPGPRTIFDGVRELAPGSCLVMDHGRRTEQTWWEPSFAEGPGDGRERLAAALEDSVRRHLIADRPVGVFLSSGVDSGAVATLAARVGGIRSFTVTFPDVDQATGSHEGAAAARVAASLGADHTEVVVDRREAGEAIPSILAAMDQPTLDGVNSWLVCRAAREAGLVVALSGLGGDELFGGYHTFGMVPQVRRMVSGVRVLPPGLRRSLALRASRRHPGGRSARVLDAAPGMLGAYRAVRGVFAPAEVGLHGWPEGGWPAPVASDPADQVSLFEMTYYLRDQTLRDTDQMSMAHSLEVRVPLLDDEVVAAALAMPSSVRVAAGKAALVHAARVQLVNPKLPFALPFSDWMRGPLQGFVREGLLSEELPFADVIPLGFRERLWQGVHDGSCHWSRPWSVAVLRMWPGANGLGW